MHIISLLSSLTCSNPLFVIKRFTKAPIRPSNTPKRTLLPHKTPSAHQKSSYAPRPTVSHPRRIRSNPSSAPTPKKTPAERSHAPLFPARLRPRSKLPSNPANDPHRCQPAPGLNDHLAPTPRTTPPADHNAINASPTHAHPPPLASKTKCQNAPRATLGRWSRDATDISRSRSTTPVGGNTL